MTCQHCSPLLSQYHDATLEPGLREEVHAHLQGCARCTAQLASYRHMDAQIAAAFRVTPHPRFKHTVLAATSDSQSAVAVEAQRRPAPTGRRSQVLMGSLTGISAAALVVLGLTVAANLPPRQQAHHQQALANRVRTSISTPGTTESPVRATVLGTLPRTIATTHARPTTMHVRENHETADQAAPREVPAAATVTLAAQPPDRAATIRIRHTFPLGSGEALMPLWSHDSRSLLYVTAYVVDPRTGWYSGTLMRYGPGGTIRLHGLVRDYAWSPDDRFIAYTAQAPDAGDSSEDAQELHIVRADGSGDRVLCRVDRASVEYLSGHIIAVRQGHVVTIDPSGAAAEPLSNLPPLQIKDEQWAFWALPADQRFFAYQDRTGLRIWDRRRGGALIVREGLARHGESSFHFSWDGKTLFYSTFDGHYTKLYRQSLDPWRPASPLNDGRPLSGPILQVGAPSPDSEVVSFRTGQGGTAESYLIDARHGPAHLLLPPGGVGPVVSWSPDGARFVYTMYRGDEAAGAAVAEVTR